MFCSEGRHKIGPRGWEVSGAPPRLPACGQTPLKSRSFCLDSVQLFTQTAFHSDGVQRFTQIVVTRWRPFETARPFETHVQKMLPRAAS